MGEESNQNSFVKFGRLIKKRQILKTSKVNPALKGRICVKTKTKNTRGLIQTPEGKDKRSQNSEIQDFGANWEAKSANKNLETFLLREENYVFLHTDNILERKLFLIFTKFNFILQDP